MTPALQFYITMVVVGLFLIGAEIFLPGGVIGALGALALVAAAVSGFLAFGAQGGFLSALLIIVLCGICIVMWVKYFPRTAMGRNLTLSQDGRQFKATGDEAKQWIGKDGTAISTLRPSGIAQIEGQRVDVVADGDWIEAGRTIRVTAAEGFRILVREVKNNPPSGGSAT